MRASNTLIRALQALLVLVPSSAAAEADVYLAAAKKQMLTNSRFQVPVNHAPGFRLSADYPSSLPEQENYPWTSIDLTTEPENYLRAVLEYVMEGNLEVQWRIQDNSIRKWYHAPWMHYGNKGREPVHGLTKERPSQEGELHKRQVSVAQNWAIGFYNLPGGYALGQVWKDPTRPATRRVTFPHGTVSAKLLFTTAQPDQVPYLDGAPQWYAQIRRDKQPVAMRLLQLDVAVRDADIDNVTGTGWAFGTFMYHKDVDESEPWKRLLPVGIMWGNDPDLTKSQYDAGGSPKEGWVNPVVAQMFEKLPRIHLGLWGRVNGPVDNPKSACLACHARALDVGYSGRRMPYSPRNFKDESIRNFFKNRSPTEPFSSGFRALDYSLQLSDGVAHFREWVKMNYPQHCEYIYSGNPNIKEKPCLPTDTTTSIVKTTPSSIDENVVQSSSESADNFVSPFGR